MYDRFVVTNNLPQHSRLVEGGALLAAMGGGSVLDAAYGVWGAASNIATWGATGIATRGDQFGEAATTGENA